jgi:hypothetical protein
MLDDACLTPPKRVAWTAEVRVLGASGCAKKVRFPQAEQRLIKEGNDLIYVRDFIGPVQQ